jgi:hypothetical protein
MADLRAPFTLWALFRPLTVIIEATLNSTSTRDRVTYFAPVIFGTVIAAIGFASEISKPQVPWTVHPILPDCSAKAQAPSGNLLDLSLYKLRCYDQKNTLHDVPQLANEFWLNDKSWPNVFFYLTAPLQKNINNQNYENERHEVQQYFRQIMDKGIYAPFFVVFYIYILSIFFLFLLLSVGIL